ncbi:hypothetical protein PG985_016454 [Apiospora marii]|uniref:uncharacterized protein n=1 Tax=Apiospora marii TaxID=335849 RepID=UPI00312E316D
MPAATTARSLHRLGRLVVWKCRSALSSPLSSPPRTLSRTSRMSGCPPLARRLAHFMIPAETLMREYSRQRTTFAPSAVCYSSNSGSRVHPEKHLALYITLALAPRTSTPDADPLYRYRCRRHLASPRVTLWPCSGLALGTLALHGRWPEKLLALRNMLPFLSTWLATPWATYSDTPTRSRDGRKGCGLACSGWNGRTRMGFGW